MSAENLSKANTTEVFRETLGKLYVVQSALESWVREESYPTVGIKQISLLVDEACNDLGELAYDGELLTD